MNNKYRFDHWLSWAKLDRYLAHHHLADGFVTIFETKIKEARKDLRQARIYYNLLKAQERQINSIMAL